MALHRIKQGYTIPIKGEAQKTIAPSNPPAFVGMYPTSFAGVKPKLAVEVNAQVKVGTPLFFDKNRPELQFTSPASGRVSAINIGPRRSLQEIIIACDPEPQFEQFKSWTEESLKSADAQSLKEEMLKAGVWPFIRQRPFNKIAKAEQTPKSIFVNCMETAPVANDPEFSLASCAEDLNFGILALSRLTSGKVYVATAPGSKTFANLKGADVHQFEGPHPAGLVGTHISRLDPINRGDVVWTVHARDLVLIGRFLKSGQVHSERIVAVSGPGASKTHYVKTQMGAQIASLVDDCLGEGEQRLISGNVLTGSKVSSQGFLGFYDDVVTIVPEGTDRHFLGWMTPGFSVPSFTRTVLSSFIPGKKFAMTSNLNGGVRAIIQSGLWEQVVAIDVCPEFLIKAAITQNIEEMEKLGIYEVDAEDFALCSYVCPSKTEVTSIIREGLELMEKEG